MHNSLERFSGRVENYIRYRPGYPDAVVNFLIEKKVLNAGNAVADIGSGTGISAEVFLKRGFDVTGVEPNTEMRKAAEELLGEYKNFRSVNGTAENTGLDTGSIDLIVAGQAFHWFDTSLCKREFARILREGGYAALLWNDRQTDTTAFLREYEEFIIRFATDYKAVNHKNFDEKIFDSFFGRGNYWLQNFDNEQVFDFDGLMGRILSSSYMPDRNSPSYPAMHDALKDLFARHQSEGKVSIKYDTRLYYGKI